MITVDRKDFTRALKLASQVVERRSTIPLLTGVKLVANGMLALEGTDLDNYIRVQIQYEGSDCELLVADPRAVLGAIGAAGGSTVEFSEVGEKKPDKRLSMKVGGFDASLCTLPADEFPTTTALDKPTFECVLGAAELAQIKRVTPAISTEETRYYLNGINVRHLESGLFRFAATDGHRLMMVDVDLRGVKGELPADFIIPRRALNIVFETFAKPEGDLSLSAQPIGRNSRLFIAGLTDGSRFELTSKSIDGTYPDYDRIIPAESKTSLRCNRAALAKAINTVVHLATEKTRAVKLTFAKGKVVCQLESPDIGRGTVEIAAEHDAPKDFAIAFNARYLSAIIDVLAGDEIDFGLQDPSAPAVITDPADTAFKAILMPMKV